MRIRLKRQAILENPEYYSSHTLLVRYEQFELGSLPIVMP